MSPVSSQLVYSSSSALSPEHFRLVRDAEEASSPAALEAILAKQIGAIKARWRKNGPGSPASVKHDLILALYCRSQRSTSSSSALTLAVEGDDPFDLSFCEPVAVQLAGGGRNATLENRSIGYRACDELFTEQPHPLKLLLVNTIREDLSVSPYLPDAQARWTLGLRAITSPRIVTSDLVPAISERILQLLTAKPAAVRRLALAALLSLVRSGEATSLLPEARSHLLSALAPPDATAPLKPKKSAPSTPQPAERDPQILSALLHAISPTSPLYPVATGEACLDIYVRTLGRISAGEWNDSKWTYHGVTCGLLACVALEGMAVVLKEDGVASGEKPKALNAILDFLDAELEKIDLAFALFLAAFSCFSAFEPTTFHDLNTARSKIFNRVLSKLRQHLESSNPNVQLLALRALTYLSPQVWTESERVDWGEDVWARLMGFLSSKDGSLRTQTLRLLERVDPNLAASHIARLIKTLSSTSSSATSVKNQKAQHEILLLALEASAIADTSSAAWAARVTELVTAAPFDIALDIIVLQTISRFTLANSTTQAGFSIALLQHEGWKTNTTLAVLVAATAGQGASSLAQREEFVEDITTWLSEPEALPPKFLDPLFEPFAISLLRLASRLPDDSSAIGTLDQRVQQLASSVPSEVLHLFDLFDTCRSSHHGRQALLQAGQDLRSDTLPGFLAAVQDHLSRPPAREDTSSLPETSSPPSSPSRPLRYQAYEPPPSSPTRSLSWRQDTKGKDRERRGGKGSGMAQSLMTPGALALIGVGEDDDSESDGDSQSSRAHFRRAVSPPSVSVERSRPRHRKPRESVNSELSEPVPTELLIDAPLNPFHDESISPAPERRLTREI